jgi:hypothetical protein
MNLQKRVFWPAQLALFLTLTILIIVFSAMSKILFIVRLRKAGRSVGQVVIWITKQMDDIFA